MIDRIDSYFDLAAIQAEFAAVKQFLADNVKQFTELYTVIKQFKGTSLTDLADNTDKLSTAINGSIQATTKAKSSYDDLTQRIAAQVKTVNENITSINQNSAAYDKLIQQAVRNKIANDDLNASAAALKKSYDSGASTLQQYTESLSSIKEAQQTIKISNQDVTKTLNALEKQAQSSAGSLDQLRGRLNELTATYDKLNEAERSSEGGQSLLKTIQTTDQAVKSMEGTTGRFRANVGNYGAPLKTLEEELARVNAQLAQMDKLGKTGGVQNLTGTGPINPVGFDPNKNKPGTPTNLALGADAARYQELSKQASALTLILSQQEKGFTSVTQQIRSSERALATLEQAGLEGSEGFEKLRESTVSAAQAQKEFMRQEKLLESEAPLLGSLTLAAKGLAGAYAVGAGAVSLFADGNEKVEKELNKMIAIMTILTGLREAYEFIQQAGAIRATFQLALTKATTIATTESGAATQAAAVANAEAAAAADAAGLATGEEAIALHAEAVAAAEAATAMEGAAAATLEMGTALSATGIGAAIAIIAIAINELITKLHDWQLGTGLTIKEQEALVEATKKVNDVLVEQAKMADEADQGMRKYYENQLVQSQASGENEFKQTAIRKTLIEEEKRLAQARIDHLGASLSSVSDLSHQMEVLTNQMQAAAEIEKAMSSVHIPDQTLLDRATNPALSQMAEARDMQLKAAKDNQIDLQKRIDAIKVLRDAQKSALEDKEVSDKKNTEEETKIAKFSADEQRRLSLETVDIQVEAVKDRNSRILALDTSSRTQRLAAIRSNAQQDIIKAESEFSAAQDQYKLGQITDTQLVESTIQRNSKIEKANRDAHNQTIDMNRKFYEQDRDANLAADKIRLNDRIKADQDIEQGKNQNNPDPLHAPVKAPISEKLAALSDEYGARRDLAAAEQKNELDQQRIDGTESLSLLEDKEAKIKEINERYNSQLIQINKDFQKTYFELEAEARQKALDDWNKYYDRRKQQIDQEEADEIKALNATGEQGKRYLRDRQKAEDNAALARAQAAVQDAEVQRNSTRDGSKERIDADDKLTKSSLTLSDTLRKQKEDAQQSTRDQAIEYAQEIEQVGDAALSLSDIGYNRQKQHLADLEIRQQRAYDQQARNIQDSTATQEQQAVRMKILDDQRATQKLQNDRRQRQLDIQKAEFDKAKAIMDIILNTAVSVVKALDNPIEAIAIGIAGAAELAIAIATPIPKYKLGAGFAGRPEHPGGLGIVGDAYESELIHEPGKAPRWSASRPTIESLLPFTKIYPKAQIEKMVMSGMFVNQQGALIMNESDNKKELKELKETIIWQTQRLESAAAKGRTRIIINNKVEAKWGEYLNRTVFDRK